MTRGIIAAALAAVALTTGACGESGGTTVINNTTTVTNATATTTGPTTVGSDESESSAEPEAEYSGPCDEVVPVETGVGAEQIEVREGTCEYARAVARTFAEGWGPACYSGCTKLIEGIRCSYGGSATVVCSAARTEVRFTMLGGA